MSQQGRQRAGMPLCAAFIDDMRNAFGEADINQQQSRGMRGEPVFWASEGGVEIGTRFPVIQAEATPVLPLVPVTPQGRR